MPNIFQRFLYSFYHTIFYLYTSFFYLAYNAWDLQNVMLQNTVRFKRYPLIQIANLFERHAIIPFFH